MSAHLPSLEFEPSILKEVYDALLFMKMKYKTREETRSSNPHLESLEKLDLDNDDKWKSVKDDMWKWVKDDKRKFMNGKSFPQVSCKYYLKVFTR